MATARKSIEIAVAPEDFFRVLQDYQSYTEFLPELKGVRLGPRDADAVEVTYWLDVKLKMFEYTLRHVEHAPARIDWHLVRGGEFLRRNEGAWTLKPTPSGGTLATYAIEIDFGPLVPRAFEKALAERGLPNLLSNFKARAEKLHPDR